jgi:ABC-2 type transport system permease protein
VQTLRSSIPKWWQTMKVSWTKYTTYRLNFFLQVIGPSLVFFFIKYNLWSSIFNGDLDISIKGYNFESMITYHVWSMIVGLLAQGHSGMNLSEDIRHGKISTYLIYPFNFWEFHTAGFLSFQVIQIFISIITLFCISTLDLVSLPAIEFIFYGMSYCLFVSLFWYTLQYLTGVLAFWLEETWMIRVLLQIITAFLSGAILPLDLYPPWLINILQFTPFPYLTYYPIKIFMGDINFMPHAYLVVSLWTILFFILNRKLWQKGMKLYTAAGM